MIRSVPPALGVALGVVVGVVVVVVVPVALGLLVVVEVGGCDVVVVVELVPQAVRPIAAMSSIARKMVNFFIIVPLNLRCFLDGIRLYNKRE